MLDGNEILLFTVRSVLPLLVGVVAVWLYYRHQFIEVLTELEDKKAIIAALANHSDELERENVRKISSQHNKKIKQTVAEKKPTKVSKTKK